MTDIGIDQGTILVGLFFFAVLSAAALGFIITRLARIERRQIILLQKLANERPPDDFGGI